MAVPLTYTGEELSSHTVFGACVAVREALEAATLTDPAAVSLVGQLEEVLTYVDSLRNVPPWLFGPDARGAMTDLEAQIRVAESHARAAGPEGDGGVTLGGNLPGVLDNIAALIRRLPTPPMAGVDVEAMTGAAEEYRRAASRGVEALGLKVAEGKAAAETVETKVAELTAEIDAGKTSVKDQIARLEAALLADDAKFEAHAAAWKTEADKEVAAFNTDAGSAIAATKAAGEKADKDLRGNAQVVLDRLDLMEKDGRGLVEAVARKTISNNYAGYALRQGALATLWAVITIGLALWGFSTLTHALAKTSNVDTSEAIMKGLASLTILGIAAFAGRESAGHRRESRDAKRVQLDLNALEPAITRMELDKQVQLRGEVLRHVFLRSPQGRDKKDSSNVNLQLSGSDVVSLITKNGSAP